MSAVLLHEPSPTRRRWHALLAALLLMAATTVATTVPASAQTEPNPPESKPTAAVAMGDSFVSGEGAGGYLPVVDSSGAVSYLPDGWTAPSDEAYFCHRSPNASIEKAVLSDIDTKFNIACSGAQIFDIENNSIGRSDGKGRKVKSQFSQLEDIAATHDIDLVLFGVGANDARFTPSAEACIEGFLTDGYTGWWETHADIADDPGILLQQLLLPGTPPQLAADRPTTKGACTSADFPSPDQAEPLTTKLTDSVQALIDKLADIDSDGEHRIVIQNYVNPMPERFADEYLTQNGRDDQRDKFRDLVDERYAAGCPVHVAALPLAQSMTESLSDIVAETQHRVLLNNPGADIVFLDVIDAFNGSHLCEQSGSPESALHTAVRARTINGDVVTALKGEGSHSLFRYHDSVSRSDIDLPFPVGFEDKKAIADMFSRCKGYRQLCQESLHPNAAGHALLGECLEGAWSAQHAVVWCNGSGGEVGVHGRAPTIDPHLSMRVSEGLDRNGNEVLVVDATWWAELFDAPGRTVQSTSVRINTGTTTLGTGSSISGAISANVRCTGSSTTIYGSVTVTLDDGTRVNGSGSVQATCPGQSGGSGGSGPGGQPGRQQPIR